ncbi:RagB/SusD family nutrient uptake outer membrane protein [Mucilaginibacter limnophilus]|uniref:RagB/SusD family nutrient uptake outer membrane protein n=2 Tax=Mucilaginibacter limnophilus TaxID=1932778 RepID=A0A437MU10_9SPHI|nr:RagB/SusD family nutrient uptake outer membrane protein [Mucilaginibacter limnophilus]
MKKIFNILLLAGTLFTSISCTKLDEKVYSTITPDKLSGKDLVYQLAPIYGQYRWLLEYQSLWDMSEQSTDAWVTPTNADGGWYDGGKWQRLHQHTWTAYDPHMESIWNALYYGVSTCNRVIYQIQSNGGLTADDEKIVSEIKVARAYYYYQLCSLYGNVPIVDKFDQPENYLPATNTRAQVLNFIVTDLRANMDNLSDAPNFGRFNKWSAKHLLAKAYQNSQAWIGVDKTDSCLIQCNDIIASGKYSLDASYAHVFSLSNSTSPEVILAFPNDEKNGVPICWPCYIQTRHGLNGPSFNASSPGFNGLRAGPSFVDTYDESDKRRANNFAQGQQYNLSTGAPIMSTDGSTPLIYTKNISSFTSAGEFDGYRFSKYEIKIGQKTETDQDWVAFRYGETLMMKAECLLRKGDYQGAAEIVNQVRARSFDASVPDAVKIITAAQLSANAVVDGVSVPDGVFLNELGREFAGEMLRREQLLRWGLFNKGTWSFFIPTNDDNLNIYPIPQTQLQANNKLVQNPGY